MQLAFLEYRKEMYDFVCTLYCTVCTLIVHNTLNTLVCSVCTSIELTDGNNADEFIPDPKQE
jgi:hypothetical protein